MKFRFFSSFLSVLFLFIVSFNSSLAQQSDFFSLFTNFFTIERVYYSPDESDIIPFFHSIFSSVESDAFQEQPLRNINAESFADTDIRCSVPAKIPADLEDVFDRALEKVPCHLVQTLQTVEIFEDAEKRFPRAMANGRKIKIRSDAVSSPEIESLILHELGHVVDLGGLRSTEYMVSSGFLDGSQIIYEDDPSVDFYRISWDFTGEKKDSHRLDFVGGYGKYDMFEDFSESFLLYIEHGNMFRTMAKENEVLAQKYYFLKHQVFNGKEFFTGQSEVDTNQRVWDITKL